VGTDSLLVFLAVSLNTAILVDERVNTDLPDTNKDSWIWQMGPAGKGKMSEKEVEEWYEKCACLSGF
jgi:hypothetical protein